jgi:hypothetical protein
MDSPPSDGDPNAAHADPTVETPRAGMAIGMEGGAPPPMDPPLSDRPPANDPADKNDPAEENSPPGTEEAETGSSRERQSWAWKNEK